MKLSGKWLIFFFLFFVILVMGISAYFYHYDKGRVFNNKQRIRFYKQKSIMEKLKSKLYSIRAEGRLARSEELAAEVGEHEFFYFPGSIGDERKIVLISRYEYICQFKAYTGELDTRISSLGFYAMYGNQLKIKKIPSQKVETILELQTKSLIPDLLNYQGRAISNHYLAKDDEQKAYLINKNTISPVKIGIE